MNTNTLTKIALAALMLTPAMAAPRLEHSRSGALAQETAPVDAAGSKLVGQLVQALREDDEAARVKAALPLLHRSLLSDDGQDIDPSVKKVAWKKAQANVAGLEEPTQIARVRSKGNLTIGEGSRKVERGRVDDYFLARRDKDALPARVTIFFPQEGEPKIYDISGL
jgi:hypothetical protein